jgi:hypothetical protein
MKKSKMLATVIALFLFVSGSSIALGQDDSPKPAEPQAMAAEHADHSSHGGAQPTDQPAVHAGHDMSQMGGMDDMKPQEEAMAANMKNMQTLMEKIKATENTAERKQLMAEHMAAMASGMKMMRDMDGKMMMGMMKSGQCPMMEMMSSPQGGHAEMKGMMGDMSKCHTMMQKKKEMNHAMMEQLVESQQQLLKLAP